MPRGQLVCHGLCQRIRRLGRKFTLILSAPRLVFRHAWVATGLEEFLKTRRVLRVQLHERSLVVVLDRLDIALVTALIAC